MRSDKNPNTFWLRWIFSTLNNSWKKISQLHSKDGKTQTFHYAAHRTAHIKSTSKCNANTSRANKQVPHSRMTHIELDGQVFSWMKQRIKGEVEQVSVRGPLSSIVQTKGSYEKTWEEHKIDMTAKPILIRLRWNIKHFWKIEKRMHQLAQWTERSLISNNKKMPWNNFD